MGAAAAAGADVAIVTSDNPRSEDPEAIIAEIAAGAGGAGGASGSSTAARRSSAPSRWRSRATSSSWPARATSRARSSRAGARCPSTTSPSPARRCVREWSPEQVAQAAGGRLVAPAPHAGRPVARGDRLARRRPRRPVRRARRRARRRRALRRRRRWPAARGGCSSRPSTPTPRAARSRARSSPPTIRWPRCSAWPPRGGARWAAPWSGSPARWARPRRRTSSPRCSPSSLRTVANRENLNTEIGLPHDGARGARRAPRRSCSRWACAGRARSPS